MAKRATVPGPPLRVRPRAARAGAQGARAARFAIIGGGRRAVLAVIGGSPGSRSAGGDTTGPPSAPAARRRTPTATPSWSATRAPDHGDVLRGPPVPVLRQFESAAGDQARTQGSTPGKVKVEYHVVYFLTARRRPTTRCAPPTREPSCWTPPAPRPPRSSTTCSTRTSPRRARAGPEDDQLSSVRAVEGRGRRAAKVSGPSRLTDALRSRCRHRTPTDRRRRTASAARRRS